VNLPVTVHRSLRMAKRIGRLVARRDVLWRYDVHPAKKFLGTAYGGWTIALNLLSSDSLVISAGVGNDVSFDLALIRRFGLQVHGYDPSPDVADWIEGQSLPDRYTFHGYGHSALTA